VRAKEGIHRRRHRHCIPIAVHHAQVARPVVTQLPPSEVPRTC
jgi:hypothetical protein